MDSGEVAHLRALIIEYKKRLNLLEVQAVRYGIDCPPHVKVEIDDIKKNIAEIEQQMGYSPTERYFLSRDSAQRLENDIDRVQQRLQEVVVTEKRIYRLFGLPVWSISVTVSRTTLLLLILLCIVNAWTLWRLNLSQSELAATQTQLSQTQRQIADVQTLIASLNGTGGSASILRTHSGEVVLIAQLPPLQPGRVYQLFRIQGVNNPVSAGIFLVDAQGYTITTLPPSQQPQAGETVAVTNEPDGGSPGPTSQPLIVGIVNA